MSKACRDEAWIDYCQKRKRTKIRELGIQEKGTPKRAKQQQQQQEQQVEERTGGERGGGGGGVGEEARR